MNIFLKNVLSSLWIYPTPTSHFFNKISDYYESNSKGRIDSNLLDGLISEVAQDQCNQYRRFWYKYSKSRKRYSEYKIKDIEHPNVHDIVINYFKSKEPYNYVKNCCILLQMNSVEFFKYEKSRQDFYDMF